MYVPHSHLLSKASNLSSLESGAIYCLSIVLYVIAISLLSDTSVTQSMPSFPVSYFPQPAIPIFGVAVTQIMVRDADPDPMLNNNTT
jgi:hypothetical protein